jgi:hypothetical protein
VLLQRETKTGCLEDMLYLLCQTNSINLHLIGRPRVFVSQTIEKGFSFSPDFFFFFSVM